MSGAPPGVVSKVAIGLAFASLAAASSCVRAPVDTPCPQLEVGELVITELRGAQAGPDSYGEWIEVYNASDREIELGGLAVSSIELDGSGETRFWVRASALSLAPGAYATLGASARVPLPGHLDYSFADDGVAGLEAAGVLTLESCGAFVDEVVYRELPEAGSWALDGAQPPSAESNDDETQWCVDARPAPPDVPMTELGLPGSPREENPPCLP